MSFRPQLVSCLDLPPQQGLEDKLGGLPWGLPLERWPFCRFCQQPMNHLLQLQHHPQRLDLGRKDGVLLGFQCTQMVHYTPENQPRYRGMETLLLVLPQSELGQGQTYPPAPGASVFPEARVGGWVEQTPAAARPEEAPLQTLLGNPLVWLTEPLEVPAGYRFLGQLNPRLRFSGPLAQGVRVDNCVPWPRFHGRFDAPASGWPERDGWGCFLFELWHSWGNGLGYLFLDERGRGLVAWQWPDVMSAQAPRLPSPFLGLEDPP